MVHPKRFKRILKSLVKKHSSERFSVFVEKGGLKKKRSREICTCGHSMNYHKVAKDNSGLTTCSAGNTDCGCIEAKPVLEVDNLRYFM